MKSVIIFILFWSSALLWAQESRLAGLPSDNVLQGYLAEAGTWAVLYSGKTETPYDIPYTNHPYFETSTYTAGTLCFNRVLYKDVLMRFDLFRDELTVIYPNRQSRIVLDNAKFDYAVLNGATIVKSFDEKARKEKFLVLLHNGTYPVVRKYSVSIKTETSDRVARSSFNIQPQYAVSRDGVLYTVKNKNALLKLFPDRKKELNEFARQHNLNFRTQPEQSIIALVNYYESLNQ